MTTISSSGTSYEQAKPPAEIYKDDFCVQDDFRIQDDASFTYQDDNSVVPIGNFTSPSTPLALLRQSSQSPHHRELLKRTTPHTHWAEDEFLGSAFR